MSEGLNKAFKRTRQAFLRLGPISVMGVLAAGRSLTWQRGNRRVERTIEWPETGIHDFNLEHASQFNTNIAPRMVGTFVQVVPNIYRQGRSSFFSHPIRAYFLRWASARTVSLELGNDADFFFTSQLGGCQIAAAPSASSVTVLHIAGDGPSATRAQNPWREAQARDALGPAFARARRFSSTDPVNGYFDAYWANVFGFRLGRGRWALWTQVVDYSAEDQVYVVRSVTELYPGPDQPAPATQAPAPLPVSTPPPLPPPLARGDAPRPTPPARIDLPVSSSSGPRAPSAGLRQFTLEDFASREFTKAKSVKASNLEMELDGTVIHVETTFLPEDMFTPLEERFSFSNYFGPTTWVVAEVFRKADQAQFFLDEAMMAQLAVAQERAELDPQNVELLIIKNVVEARTREFLHSIPNGALSDDNFKRLLTETPFGKFAGRLGVRIHKSPSGAKQDLKNGHLWISMADAAPKDESP